LLNNLGFLSVFSGFPAMFDESGPVVGVEEEFTPLLEGEVVELPLLLPRWQALILETLAHQRGMTAAAMVRHLLREFLDGESAPHCPSSY
jgi:hypothetical protein